MNNGRSSGSSCVVVPCYNEAARLDSRAFSEFAAANDVSLLFVDDGSSDDTPRVLEALSQTAPARIRWMRLDQNAGKAEAVRHGLIAACSTGARYVGFWDADLATPLEDINAFRTVLDARPEIDMVFGARVNLLGRSVHRNLARHYVGRMFATAAAFVLRVGIYDTQCGAKLFRNSPRFAENLREPFIGGWIFDVEMIARDIASRKAGNLPPVRRAIYEFPLQTWRDVAGSKIKPTDWFRVSANLVRIYARYSLFGRAK